MTLQLNGSEIVVEMLIREGVPYAIGIPGHGNLPLIDALRRRQDKIKVIMPRHEQAAVHMADGYFRAAGSRWRSIPRSAPAPPTPRSAWPPPTSTRSRCSC